MNDLKLTSNHAVPYISQGPGMKIFKQQYTYYNIYICILLVNLVIYLCKFQRVHVQCTLVVHVILISVTVGYNVLFVINHS